MNAFTHDGSLPKDQRFEVVEPDLANVELVRKNGESCHVTMLDLSRQGVKIVSDTCIPTGEAIRLHFRVSAAELRFDAAAKVCWARPTEGETWYIACSLDSEIPAATFEQMGSVGLVEQRSKPRRALSIPCRTRWELRDIHVEGTILDATDRGVCLAVPECGRVGDRVQIKLPLADGTEVVILARAAWTMTRDNGQRVGCRVIHGLTPDQLGEMIGTSTPGEEPPDETGVTPPACTS